MAMPQWLVSLLRVCPVRSADFCSWRSSSSWSSRLLHSWPSALVVALRACRLALLRCCLPFAVAFFARLPSLPSWLSWLCPARLLFVSSWPPRPDAVVCCPCCCFPSRLTAPSYPPPAYPRAPAAPPTPVPSRRVPSSGLLVSARPPVSTHFSFSPDRITSSTV